MGFRRNARRVSAVVAISVLSTVTLGACSSKAARPTGDGQLGAIRTRGKIVVGLKFDLPAFSVKDPTTGRIEGFDADIGRVLASELFGDQQERHVEFVEVVSRDREEAIASGRVDLVVSTYTITDARKKLVSFAGPYYVAGQDILVRRSNTDITGVDSLSGRKVCSVDGSTSLANVRKLAPTADTSVSFDRYSLCVDALRDGRVDAVTTDDAILLGFLRQDPDNLRLVGKPFTTEPYGVGMRLESNALREFVNDALTRIYEDGRWRAIYESTIGKAGLLAPKPPQIES
jgi:glutamate transport system substrate-binding protein